MRCREDKGDHKPQQAVDTRETEEKRDSRSRVSSRQTLQLQVNEVRGSFILLRHLILVTDDFLSCPESPGEILSSSSLQENEVRGSFILRRYLFLVTEGVETDPESTGIMLSRFRI